MKSTFARALLVLAMTAGAACGARTPLDPLDDQTPGWGNTAGGPSLATGGTGAGNGGWIGAGGKGSGGFTIFYDGGGGSGGNGGRGGAVNSGGAGGGFVLGGLPAWGGRGGAMAGGSGGTPFRDGGLGGTAGKKDGGGDLRDFGADRVDSLSLGGAIGVGGAMATGGSGGCPGLASNEELIDDLNDGDRFIPRVNGRVGSWVDSHDSSPGSMYPDPAVGLFTPTDTGDSCRKYAAYVKGTGFSDWGAAFWFGLGSPYDASKYTGVSFWAKTDNPSQRLQVSFPDKDTATEGGICKPNGPSSTACLDHFASFIQLTPNWKKYTIAFKELSQGGWGMKATAFDPSTLYQVLFQIPVNATFAIWVDDVAFTF